MSEQRVEPKLPLWGKIVYSLFVAVLVPYYWIEYGPTNFLYFCDVALLTTLVGIWRESSLLVSMPAVGIILPQTLWMVDFLAELLGVPFTGMTAYMFDEKYAIFTRGLSFFHFWLPPLLLWLVWRLGYDRRAMRMWTYLAWGLLVVCYVFLPPPPAPAHTPNLPVNVNYVYGMSAESPQDWLPPNVYFGLVLLALPTLIFWPTHRLLCRFFAPREVGK